MILISGYSCRQQFLSCILVLLSAAILIQATDELEARMVNSIGSCTIDDRYLGVQELPKLFIDNIESLITAGLMSSISGKSMGESGLKSQHHLMEREHKHEARRAMNAHVSDDVDRYI